MNKQFITITGN